MSSSFSIKYCQISITFSRLVYRNDRNCKRLQKSRLDLRKFEELNSKREREREGLMQRKIEGNLPMQRRLGERGGMGGWATVVHVGTEVDLNLPKKR